MPHELILGTAGHIDHGKTALVQALTGVDTDRLQQEKERGISIDIGFARLDLDEHRLGIVDVPGHERFIRNMLAGASGIDLAALVVAADDSVMPQTREHLAILELLQVRHGVIVITKADLVEPAWLELVEADVRDLCAGTFLADAPIVVTSVVDGRGLDELRAALEKVCRRVEPRGGADRFCLAVDRAFALQGLGTVVTGTVWSGSVSAGDEVQWLPVDRPVRVRSVQSHGDDAQTVGRGQRAALNLMGVHHGDIRRGHVLAAPGHLRPSRRLTARLRVLEDSQWPIRHRSRVRLYVGTQEVMATVWLLRGTSIAQGQWAYAQLHGAEPVVAHGRQPLVVRLESPLRTIGGGHVLQAVAGRLSRRDPDAPAWLDRLWSGGDEQRAAAAVSLAGATTLTAMDLCRELDVPASRAEELIAALDASGETVQLGAGGRRQMRIHRETLDGLRRRVERALRRLHDAAPLEARVPRQRLLRKLESLEEDLVHAVLDRLIADGVLAGDETGVALAGFQPRLTGAQRDLRDEIVRAYRDGGFGPPDPAELAGQRGVSDAQLRSILQLCVEQGDLVHVDGGLYLHRDAEERLRESVQRSLRGGGGLTVSQIRDLLGTSRKYAVPFCEYMDRIGLTRRQGDLRVLAGG